MTAMGRHDGGDMSTTTRLSFEEFLKIQESEDRICGLNEAADLFLEGLDKLHEL